MVKKTKESKKDSNAPTNKPDLEPKFENKIEGKEAILALQKTLGMYKPEDLAKRLEHLEGEVNSLKDLIARAINTNTEKTLKD